MNLLTMEHVTKAYTDRVLLDDVAFGINENEKIGVIGINGMGKSTLLKIVAGVEEYDSGNLSMGNTVKICYLPQTPVFGEEETVLQAAVRGIISDTDQWTMEAEAKSMLNQLGFSDYEEKMSHMSGGQKKRVALVNALLTPADILVLDEPTNHLDIASREWIEDALSDYTQALLFVSHDRYFIEKFATRIWLLENGTITDYRGTYEEFRAYRARQTALQQTAKAVERKKEPKPKPKRAPNTTRARERTEREIEKLEGQLAALDAESEANATDYQKLMEIDARKQALNAQLEALYEAWEALCE